MPKNILVFMDGTRNKPSDERRMEDTNVWKMFKMFAVRENSTVATYVRGVGTETLGGLALKTRKMLQSTPWVDDQPARLRGRFVFHSPQWAAMNVGGSALGWGVAERIVEGYRFVCSNYEPGDKVYLFGFSRGAYQARSLASFIDRVGTAFRAQSTGPDPRRLIARAYLIFRAGDEASNALLSQFIEASTHSKVLNLRHPSIDVHFVGVWDTVAALGGIGEPRTNEFRTTAKLRQLFPGKALADIREKLARVTSTKTGEHLPQSIPRGSHAIAAHELRRPFEVMLWKAPAPGQLIKQRWFAGAHADVGGGYSSRKLADIALLWMVDQAESASKLEGAIPLVHVPLEKPVERRGASSTKVEPGEPQVSEELGKPHMPHHEIKGWFSMLKPTPRVALQHAPTVDPAVMRTCDVDPQSLRRSLLLLNQEFGHYPFHLAHPFPWPAQYPAHIDTALKEIDDLLIVFHVLVNRNSEAEVGNQQANKSIEPQWASLRDIDEIHNAKWLLDPVRLESRDHDISLSKYLAMLLALELDEPCEEVVDKLILRHQTNDTEGDVDKDALDRLIDEVRSLPKHVPRRRFDAATRLIQRLEAATGKPEAGGARNASE